MAPDPLPPEQLAELCEAYRAGKGLRPLCLEYRRPRAEIRSLLVGAGVDIRPSHRQAALDRLRAQVSSTERDARVRTVAGFIARGIHSRHEILEAVNDPKRKYQWGVELSTIDRYIAEARARLHAEGKPDEEFLRALAEIRYEELYRRAWINDDVKACLAILRDRNQFHGFYPAAEVKHSGKIEGGQVVVYIPDNGRDPKE